jgi:hypothetical protein
MVLEDQRSRKEAALTAWVTVWGVAAQNGTPVPPISEFLAAVGGDTQASALTWQTLAGTQPNTPGATPPPAPPPAAAAPQFGIPAPPGGGGPPARPMMALPPITPAGGPVPSLPAGLPPNASPPGSPLGISPAAAIALRQRLMGGGGGTAASLLATRGALPPAS